MGLFAQLAVGEGPVVVDKRQAFRAGHVCLLYFAGGGEAVTREDRRSQGHRPWPAGGANEAGAEERRDKAREGGGVEGYIRKLHKVLIERRGKEVTETADSPQSKRQPVTGVAIVT